MKKHEEATKIIAKALTELSELNYRGFIAVSKDKIANPPIVASSLPDKDQSEFFIAAVAASYIDADIAKIHETVNVKNKIKDEDKPMFS